MSRAPFQQLPFAALPALPRIPHPYFSTPARELSLHSTAFGDVRVHCRVHGSGPPLLLVHGLMTSSYSFRYVLEPLGQHFTVYVPDLPGSGRSSETVITVNSAVNAAIASASGRIASAAKSGRRSHWRVANQSGVRACMNSFSAHGCRS